jgi:predicted transcriptional regulator of viral defense system
LADVEALVPDLGHQAFKMVVSRAVKQGILHRACHGLYLFEGAARRYPSSGSS